MFNPRSMNVKLLPKIFSHLPIVFLLWCFALSGYAQDYAQLNVLKNETLVFSFDNYGSISFHAPTVQEQALHGLVKFNPSSTSSNQKGIAGQYPTLNTIEYTPDNDYLGEDVFAIRYRKLVDGSSTVATWGTKIFVINVIPSSILANDDYTTLVGGGSIIIDVLANDFNDGTNLSIASVPVTNNGTVQLINNNTAVEFTPYAGFDGIADFNYTICDAQGACDVAVVNICVVNGTPNYELLKIFTKENTSQVVIAALEGFTLSNNPNNGIVTDTSGVWTYHPNTNFDGIDNFSLVDGSGNVQEVEINVLNASKENLFLRPDTYFVAVDGEALLTPLENDLASDLLVGVNLYEYNGSGQVVFDYASKTFSYIPAVGFTGVDQFRYRGKPPTSFYYEYETVTIVVSNQAPASVNYQIITPEATPMVIAYNVPIEDYTYLNVEDAGLAYGIVEFYDGETTQNINGQDVSGFNMLVYYPNDAPVGAIESFEYEYCAGGGFTDCHQVKINVEIKNITGSGSDFCVGPECVWTGDTNTDGVVDIRDLLPIGLCIGEVGVSRPDADANWYGQYANNWNSLMATGLFDVKHVDVDGSGIVEAADTASISAHYGMHHNPTPQVNGLLISDDKLTWGDGNPLTIQAGDVILVPFYYGNENNPVIDGYGFTFELPYAPNFFEDVNILYEDESWMSYNSPILTMDIDVAPGILHSGYTRTSGAAASGYGFIGNVEFIVYDDIDGFRINDNEISVSINPMGEMNSSGQTSTSGSSQLTFILDLEEEGSELDFIEEDKLLVYPNPVSITDLLTIHLNGLGNEIEQVAVYSVTGQEVYNSGTIQTKRMQLDISSFIDGIYIVKAFTNGGVITKKVEIIK